MVRSSNTRSSRAMHWTYCALEVARNYRATLRERAVDDKKLVGAPRVIRAPDHHQDGLVHISTLARQFVRDPREVVKAGNVVRGWKSMCSVSVSRSVSVSALQRALGEGGAKDR